MNRRMWRLAVGGVGLVAFGWGGREEREEEAADHARTAGGPPMQVNWIAVDQALGRSGAPQPGDVHKFGLPRSDLAVTVDRIHLPPPLPLGSSHASKAASSPAVLLATPVP